MEDDKIGSEKSLMNLQKYKNCDLPPFLKGDFINAECYASKGTLWT
jgi:hypothetical protein